ncbi:MAG: hypothetical protein VW405_02380 [Rhodospirillaceae bacterium]
MAIHATANPANVRRSVEKYLVDTFQGATGIPTDIEAANWWWQNRKIDTGSLDYFVRVRVDRVAQTLFGSSLNIVWFSLFLEVWAKRVAYDTAPDTLEQTLGLLRGGLTRGTAIGLYDYVENGVSATIQQYLTVEEPRLPITAEEGEWVRSSWDVTLRTIETDTSS